MLSTIGLVLDVVVLCVIAISAIIGFKKGFLKSVLDFFSWIVCLAVAILLAKYVARLINGIYDFASLIGSKISAGLHGDYFNTPINEMSAEQIAAIPSGLNGFLTQIVKIVLDSSKFDPASTSTIGALVGTSVGSISMVIISGILVFIVLKIVVFILSKIFNKIASTKILGTLNKILGLAFGVLKAAFVIVALNFVLCLLTLIPFVNKTIKPLVQDNTHIEKVVYNATDKFTGKYIIKGKLIQGWLTTLWNNK